MWKLYQGDNGVRRKADWVQEVGGSVNAKSGLIRLHRSIWYEPIILQAQVLVDTPGPQRLPQGKGSNVPLPKRHCYCYTVVLWWIGLHYLPYICWSFRGYSLIGDKVFCKSRRHTNQLIIQNKQTQKHRNPIGSQRHITWGYISSKWFANMSPIASEILLRLITWMIWH